MSLFARKIGCELLRSSHQFALPIGRTLGLGLEIRLLDSDPGEDCRSRRFGIPQGLHAFLRAYYHVKSADWKENRPYRLAGSSAADYAQLPTYYVMDVDCDMAATVAPHMPTPAAVAACAWLPEAELAAWEGAYSWEPPKPQPKKIRARSRK